MKISKGLCYNKGIWLAALGHPHIFGKSRGGSWKCSRKYVYFFILLSGLDEQCVCSCLKAVHPTKPRPFNRGVPGGPGRYRRGFLVHDCNLKPPPPWISDCNLNLFSLMRGSPECCWAWVEVPGSAKAENPCTKLPGAPFLNRPQHDSQPCWGWQREKEGNTLLSGLGWRWLLLCLWLLLWSECPAEMHAHLHVAFD